MSMILIQHLRTSLNNCNFSEPLRTGNLKMSTTRPTAPKRPPSCADCYPAVFPMRWGTTLWRVHCTPSCSIYSLSSDGYQLSNPHPSLQTKPHICIALWLRCGQRSKTTEQCYDVHYIFCTQLHGAISKALYCKILGSWETVSQVSGVDNGLYGGALTYNIQQ